MKLIMQPVSDHAKRQRVVTVSYFDPERQPSRSTVRSIACPKCYAPSSEPCVLRNGSERVQNHQQRVNAYKARFAVM